MSSQTIFEKIIKKELPADIVYEDETVLAFKDINPQAPIHILVIPKKKILDFSQLIEFDNEYAGLYFKGISKVVAALKIEKGYRVIFNQGKHGQQTVDYIHAHILAGRQLQWPPG